MRFSPRANTVRIKNEENLAAMRRAGRLASECLEWILGQVEPGMCTLDIDDLQMQFARRHDVTPAPLGYKGFPRSICTSRNEVICHGIPSRDVVLREGDIVGIDVGIQAVRPGARLGDIGHAIQSVVEPEGYSVVRDFVGHGIGRGFHEEPQIPHFGEPGRGLRLRAGMTFTVEPMINAGVPDVEIQGDGWTALTGDRRLSAQYEHTLEVTDEGVRVLTVQNDEGTWEPPGRWWPPGFRFGDVG
jgi:methionyl aminopeptidase